MNRKKEPCRNFQRGSCQYGERCKFLHATPQHTKINPFGFGVQNGSQFIQTNQQQQQKPNPFGFGVQRSPQTKGGSDFISTYQNQVKPFENKWSRLSSTSTGTSTSSQQSDTQQQQVNHNCTDSEACKRQIIEDLRNERPLWKLTCYGHCKGRPCDIYGDVSYEELQAAAYEDARRGLSLQSIVDRERNLLNSKLIEFENLLQKPYIILPDTTSATNPFPISNATVSSSFNQHTGPPSLSSFSQLGASMNFAFNNRMTPPPNGTLSQSNPGQSNPFPAANQGASFLATNNLPFGGSGFSNGQTPTQTFGNMGNSSSQNSNFVPVSTGSNLFSPLVAPPSFPILVNNQLSDNFKMSNLNADVAAVLPVKDQTLQEKKVEGPKDTSIWLKAEWKRGEIPEDAPPEQFT